MCLLVLLLQALNSIFIGIGLREHVLLLHIIEGDTSIRAHDGTLLNYNDGAWHQFIGVISEAILKRCKEYLIQLEGVFRTMATSVIVLEVDSEVRLLRALNSIWDANRIVSDSTFATRLTKLSLQGAAPEQENRWGYGRIESL